MHKSKSSDRPDWWGPRWNPETRAFEYPGSSSQRPPFNADDYDFDDPPVHKPRRATNQVVRPPSSVRSASRSSSLTAPSDLQNTELTDILNQLLNKIDSQRQEIDEIQSRFIEEKHRGESILRENMQLHSEVGKLRQVVRDLSQVNPKTTRRVSTPSKSSIIPGMYLDENAPKEVFDAVYRSLANKYHPDKGGDEEKQKELNLTKEDIYKKKGWS